MNSSIKTTTSSFNLNFIIKNQQKKPPSTKTINLHKTKNSQKQTNHLP